MAARIAFFGSSLISAYWNGAATYYRGIIRALHGLGYDITFYEPEAYDRQKHRDIADPSWARVVVYAGDDDSAAYRALASAKNADIIVKASGVGVYDQLLEKAVLDLKNSRRLVVFWDVDAPATLAKMRSDPSDPLRGLIPSYDLVLTYGGGAPVVDAYKAFGAKACAPIYNAFDPSTHFPVAAESRFRAKLGFLGNRLPDREERVEEFFLRPAAENPKLQFLLGGNGWDDKARPSNVRYLGHVYTRDHNAFNSSSEAILNVSRESMASTGFSPATRFFEAAGAGACLITDAWTGIEQFLQPDREVLVASNGNEVTEHLRRLTPERRKAIGAAARRRILREHTYTNRAERLHRILSDRAALKEAS